MSPSGSALSAQDCCPPLGSRVEVLWHIEFEVEAATGAGVAEAALPAEERWWGATVQERNCETASELAGSRHADKPVHSLLYDSHGDFEESTARVVFISKSRLVDIDRQGEALGGLLDWRFEGQPCALDCGDGTDHVTMEEVVAAQAALDSETGVSIADAGLEAMSELPLVQQRKLASEYRSMADKIKLKLSELAMRPGYVITNSDIETIFTQLKNSS